MQISRLSRPELLWILDGFGVHLILDVLLRHCRMEILVCCVVPQEGRSGFFRGSPGFDYSFYEPDTTTVRPEEKKRESQVVNRSRSECLPRQEALKDAF